MRPNTRSSAMRALKIIHGTSVNLYCSNVKDVWYSYEIMPYYLSLCPMCKWDSQLVTLVHVCLFSWSWMHPLSWNNLDFEYWVNHRERATAMIAHVGKISTHVTHYQLVWPTSQIQWNHGCFRRKLKTTVNRIIHQQRSVVKNENKLHTANSYLSIKNQEELPKDYYFKQTKGRCEIPNALHYKELHLILVDALSNPLA